MALSKIPWTDYTHNLWWGCSRVSAGCKNCYAARFAPVYGHAGLWHRAGPRRFLSAAHLAKPWKWERDAAAGDPNQLVFSGSMMDLFEVHPNKAIRARQDDLRAGLWEMIAATPHLIWQLLTTRIEEVAGLVPWGDDWPPNVWLGASVESQRYVDERLAILNELPAKVRFASVEPQLEDVDLSRWLDRPGRPGVHQALVGGESGPEARPFALDWARNIRDQVAESNAAFFMKQAGEQAARELGLADRKGEALAELPEDLRIRQFPAGYERAA